MSAGVCILHTSATRTRTPGTCAIAGNALVANPYPLRLTTQLIVCLAFLAFSVVFAITVMALSSFRAGANLGVALIILYALSLIAVILSYNLYVLASAYARTHARTHARTTHKHTHTHTHTHTTQQVCGVFDLDSGPRRVWSGRFICHSTQPRRWARKAWQCCECPRGMAAAVSRRSPRRGRAMTFDDAIVWWTGSCGTMLMGCE